MNKVSFLIIAILLGIVFTGTRCTSNRKVQPVKSIDEIESQLSSDIGEKIRCRHNETATFLLCNNQEKGMQKPLKISVFDLDKNEVIYEKAIPQGSVAWVNDQMVEIKEQLGNRTKEHPEGYRVYYYDISLRKELQQIPEEK